MSASALPQEVWQRILRYVSLQDRLGNCSLVCHKFYAAAVAATQCLTSDMKYGQEQRADGVRAWLQHHGGVVTSLSLDMALTRSLLDLPCQHLQDLKLSSCGVQLGAAGGFPGVLQDCATCLTRLVFQNCFVLDRSRRKVLNSIAQLVVLRHLELRYVKNRRVTQGVVSDGDMELPGEAISQLTNLTCLHLEYSPTDQHLRHISCLQALRCLHLSGSVPGGTLDFPLPACLQALTLSSNHDHQTVLSATVLSDLVHLTSLHLARLTVQDGADLLAALQALQQLQTLDITNIRTDWPAVSAAYGALTASSHLTHLVLSWLSFPDFPAGALQHMFPPGHMLPHLLHHGFYQNVSALMPADLSSLVSSCPGLRELNCCLQHNTVPVVLTQLSSLTCLQLSFHWGNQLSARCMPVLALMTRLRRLELHLAGDLVGLLPLTALRQLTFLSHYSVDRRTWLTPKCCPVPDVWVQLLVHCAAEAGLQSSTMQAVCQQLAQKEVHSAQQQDMMTALQQSCSQQQQELGQHRVRAEQQQQQIAVLQQESSAARADAAELRQQVQGLQGQMQVLQAQVQQLLAQLGGGQQHVY